MRSAHIAVLAQAVVRRWVEKRLTTVGFEQLLDIA